MYCGILNLLFLSKVVEQVMVSQPQQVLGETDYLDPFQSSFRQGFGMETALVDT